MANTIPCPHGLLTTHQYQREERKTCSAGKPGEPCSHGSTNTHAYVNHVYVTCSLAR